MVYIDDHKFRQVISNLVGNALKFTPSGGSVTVVISCDKARDCVRVDVIDTGVGIAQVRSIHPFQDYSLSDRIPIDLCHRKISMLYSRE